METVLIAANPKSGTTSRRELVVQLENGIRGEGFHCESIFELEALEQRIREIHSEGALRAVVAAGGDGTVSAVASRTAPEVPIGILPLGSENLLAQYLSISRSPAACCKAIARNHTRQIDAMLVNGQIATLMASVGYDAEVVRRVHANRRSHITRWAYRYQALLAWWAYGFPRFDVVVTHEEKTITHRSQWCFVFNIPRYAAGLKLIEQTNPDDGLLDICLFESSGRLRGLAQFWDVLRGRHQHRSDWRHLTGSHIRIQPPANESSIDSAGPPAPMQYDGDWGGFSPFSISVLPHRLRLLV